MGRRSRSRSQLNGSSVLSCKNTEPWIKVCTWLWEVSSCSCLTVVPGPAWLLLNKICIPLFRALHRVRRLVECLLHLAGDCFHNFRRLKNATAKNVNIGLSANVSPNIGFQPDGGLCISVRHDSEGALSDSDSDSGGRKGAFIWVHYQIGWMIHHCRCAPGTEHPSRGWRGNARYGLVRCQVRLARFMNWFFWQGTVKKNRFFTLKNNFLSNETRHTIRSIWESIQH